MFFTDLLTNCANSSNYYLKTTQDLVYDENHDEEKINEFYYYDQDLNQLDQVNEHEDEHEGESSSSSYKPTPPTKKPKTFVSFDDKLKAVNYWNSTKTINKRTGKLNKMKVSTVQKAFSYVSSWQQLREWELQIDNTGSRNDKLKQIVSYTIGQFTKAKRNHLIVHERDIRRWSLKKNQEISLSNFRASHQWIWKLKNANGIVSRKITKFITHNFTRENLNIQETAKQFVESSRQYFDQYLPNEIFNSDQSGFNYELHSGRTLAFKGTKEVAAVVQSKSSMTHSYSIQITSSADGSLISPLYIVLQERNGEFGSRVQRDMFTAQNIFIQASASGKLMKSHLLNWFTEVYFKNVPNDTLLLVDSWTTYNDQQAIDNVKPGDKNVKILRIPPKTTPLIQPLDVYFFRMYKNFVRRFYDRVELDDIQVNLYHRDDILKLHSLVHQQFSSPIFSNFIKFSWYKSGYIKDRPPKFKTPAEHCFDHDEEDCFSDCSQCTNGVFIKCSWCFKSFCFKHFFIEYHFCDRLLRLV